MQKILTKITSWVTTIEETTIPLNNYILTFIFILGLRYALELFSDVTIISIPQFFHYYLFFAAFFFSVILLWHYITRVALDKIAKLLTPLFLVIAAPPISDLILSLGKGFNMSYLFPEVHGNIWLRFITFFGEFSSFGITPGMRINFVLMMVVTALYVFIKTSKLWKSILGALAMYVLIFAYVSTPVLLDAFFSLVNLNYFYSDALIINTYLVVMLFVLGSLAWIYNKEYVKIIFRDIRISRVLMLLTLYSLGIAIGLNKSDFSFDVVNVFHIFFIPVIIVAGWIYSVITNNIEDIVIDKVSNQDRPLAQESIPQGIYERIGWIFLIIALAFALAVNFKIFFLMLLFVGNYYIYSMRPLRLKRVPLFSKLPSSIACLAVVIAGFLVVTGDFIINFPIPIIIGFLLVFTFGANLIDIKDYEGDKVAGIPTLPVLLGLKRSKIIIGIFFVLAYASVYFFAPALTWVFLGIGCLQFYFITKEKYKELPIIIIMFVSFMILLPFALTHNVTSDPEPILMIQKHL